MAVAALYLLLAWKAHVFVLAVCPIMMSVRRKSRSEPLAGVAILAAVVVALVGVYGLTHR